MHDNTITVDIDNLRSIAANAQRAWESLCQAHHYDICSDCGGIIDDSVHASVSPVPADATCDHDVLLSEYCRYCESDMRADELADMVGEPTSADTYGPDCNSCPCPIAYRGHCCGDYDCPVNHARIDEALKAYHTAFSPAVALDVIQLLDMAIARATNKMSTATEGSNSSEAIKGD